MKKLLRLLIMLVCLVSLVIASDQPNTYTNHTVGLSLTKPSQWHYMTAEQNQENLEQTRLKDEEFQKFLQRYATAPLVAITKYPEPYDDLNPSLKVNIKPLGMLPKDNPVKIITLIMHQLKNVFEDFSVQKGPIDTLVSGLNAAYVRIHYSMKTKDDQVFPTCSELWIIPKGSFLFMIGAGTRQDEKTGKRKEIVDILATLKIEKE